MVTQNLWTILPSDRFYYDEHYHMLQFSGAINPPVDNVFRAFSVILPNSDARLVRFWQEDVSGKYLISAVPLIDLEPVFCDVFKEMWAMLYLIVPANEQKTYFHVRELLTHVYRYKGFPSYISQQIKIISQNKPANMHPLFSSLVNELIASTPLMIGLNGEVAAIYRFFSAFFTFVREFSCSDNFAVPVEETIYHLFTNRIFLVPSVTVLHQP